ncbi:MAG: ComEC/Rec2 family competence protein [Isosphaeraceae bacterium]
MGPDTLLSVSELRVEARPHEGRAGGHTHHAPSVRAIPRPGARRVAIAPLAPLVAAVATGIVFDRFREPCDTSAWAILGLAFGAIAALSVRRELISSLALLGAFLAIGAGWHHYRWSDLDPDDLVWVLTESPKPVWARGVVREALGLRHSAGFGFGSAPAERVTTRFVLDLTAVTDDGRWRRATGRAMVTVTGDRSEVRAGQAIETAGQIARIARPLNPGEFDYATFLRAAGTRLRLTVDDPESFWADPRGGGSMFTRWLGHLRSMCRARLVEDLDPSVAPLAAALLLGQREGVEPEVNDAFARTGTTHLLAISGLQLQALAAALLVFLRAARVPRRAAYFGVALTTTAYAVLVGLAPSVVRSTVMTLTFCLAAMAQRKARPANTLALAALVTLAVNPAYLFDIGCQLSFLAIGALIWLVPPGLELARQGHEAILRRLFGPRSALHDRELRFEPWWRTRLRQAGELVVKGVIVSGIVWLAALPLVALKFHIVSPIAVILNIPLIPMTSAALLLGGLGLGLSTVWGPLGTAPAWAAAWLLKLSKSVVLWGVGQPWGHRFVVGPSWEWVLVFYMILGAATFLVVAAQRAPPQDHRGRFIFQAPWWLLAAWVVPGWLLAGLGSGPATLESELLAVGHGLAVVIQTPGGQTFLYDCGRMGDPSVGRRIVAPALWARGISRIDTVFLSHADHDHYDGLPDLLDRFAIGQVRVPPGFGGPSNPGAIALLEELRSRGIPVRPTVASESWETGGVHFTVLHPAAGWHPEASDNARSLVLDVAFAGRHLLLTGDLEQQGLTELVGKAAPDPPPDVMLAPHHGGKAANPAWLYKWAKPRAVVVSQKASAPRSGDALAPIEGRGTPLLRTWRQGAIRLRVTGVGITARGFLEKGDDPGRLMIFAGVLTGRGSLVEVPGLKFLIGLAGFAIGLFGCVVLAVVEFAAWAMVAPPRTRRDDDQDDAAARELDALVQPIEVRAPDAARLRGRFLPARGPIPTGRTILLLHGFAETSSALERRRMAALSRHGWNVAALDSRGYGQSDGPYATFGGRESSDVRAWLDRLAECVARTGPPAVFRPVLWGRSMGAQIAVRAAVEDARVAALVLEAPLVDLAAAIALALEKRRFPMSGLLAGLILHRASKLAKMPLDRPRPIDLAPRVTCPVVILHGSDDTLVPAAEARRLAAAFPEPPVWLEVPGAGHSNVVDTGGEPLLDQVAAFLGKAVGALEPGSGTTPEQVVRP